MVRFGGVRIAGISGIFNQPHYHLGHFERPPYDSSSVRSAYHVRELEAYRLLQVRCLRKKTGGCLVAVAPVELQMFKCIIQALRSPGLQLQQPVDVFLSHDWPNQITRCGDADRLFAKKPYFKAEVRVMASLLLTLLVPVLRLPTVHSAVAFAAYDCERRHCAANSAARLANRSWVS